MVLDNGLFVVIFGGIGLCVLYFWSALRERVRSRLAINRRRAVYRQMQLRLNASDRRVCS